MSDRPVPVWTTTEISDGNLVVNIDGVVDEYWLSAANKTATLWDGETRGQTWDSIVFTHHAIHLLEVEDETDVAHLRNYVSDLITAATAESERLRARYEQQRAQEAAEEEARHQKDQSLTQRFRDLS
jgi:hypothetical protein